MLINDRSRLKLRRKLVPLTGMNFMYVPVWILTTTRVCLWHRKLVRLYVEYGKYTSVARSHDQVAMGLCFCLVVYRQVGVNRTIGRIMREPTRTTWSVVSNCDDCRSIKVCTCTQLRFGAHSNRGTFRQSRTERFLGLTGFRTLP